MARMKPLDLTYNSRARKYRPLSAYTAPYVPEICGPCDSVGFHAFTLNRGTLTGPSVPVSLPYQEGHKYGTCSFSDQQSHGGGGYLSHHHSPFWTAHNSYRSIVLSRVMDLTAKSARQSMQRIVKSMKPRDGDDTAFAGASSGARRQPSSHTDAEAFVDGLSKKVQVEDGVVCAFPLDQFVHRWIHSPGSRRLNSFVD